MIRIRPGHAVTLAAALTLAVGLAEAKPLSKMLAETRLTPQDMVLMGSAADAVLGAGPKVEARRDWENAESGSRGNVQVMTLDGQCATLRHQFRAGTATRTEQVMTVRCRDAQGNWVAQ